jgi:hypothetical protein
MNDARNQRSGKQSDGNLRGEETQRSRQRAKTPHIRDYSATMAGRDTRNIPPIDAIAVHGLEAQASSSLHPPSQAVGGGFRMLDKKSDDSAVRQPSGFTQHNGGLASEYAREQGWSMNEEERARDAQAKQDAAGGTDYEYGATDFGDSAVDTSAVQPAAKNAKRIISIPIESTPKPAKR